MQLEVDDELAQRIAVADLKEFRDIVRKGMGEKNELFAALDLVIAAYSADGVE